MEFILFAMQALCRIGSFALNQTLLTMAIQDLKPTEIPFSPNRNGESFMKQHSHLYPTFRESSESFASKNLWY